MSFFFPNATTYVPRPILTPTTSTEAVYQLAGTYNVDVSPCSSPASTDFSMCDTASSPTISDLDLGEIDSKHPLIAIGLGLTIIPEHEDFPLLASPTSSATASSTAAPVSQALVPAPDPHSPTGILLAFLRGLQESTAANG